MRFYRSRSLLDGQHDEMLSQALKVFSLKLDYDLKVMKTANSLSEIHQQIVMEFSKVLQIEQPDYVVVHGDTITTLSCSQVAFWEKTRVIHIEAGLRSGDIYSPWPEEMNRKLVSQLADLHFAPTSEAKQNLIKEGCWAEKYTFAVIVS